MSSKKDRNANINTARQQHTNVGTLLYRHVTFTTQYKAILLPCSMLTPVIALLDHADYKSRFHLLSDLRWNLQAHMLANLKPVDLG